MDRRLSIAFALIAAVLISGCPQAAPEEGIAVGEIFIGGSQGLAFNFLSGSPPPEIFDDSTNQFQIGIQVENKGEDDVAIGELKLFIEGLNPATYLAATVSDRPGKFQQLSTEALTKAELLTEAAAIQGGRLFMFFPNADTFFSYQSRLLSGSVQQNILAKACYLYSTKAVGPICLRGRESIYAQATGVEVCQVEGDKVFESSGAPIQVTRVTEVPAGNSFILNVELQNTGPGQAFLKKFDAAPSLDDDVSTTKNESIIECSDLQFAELDKVWLRNVTVGGKGVLSVTEGDGKAMACSPSPLIRLTDNGKGVFTCRYTPANLTGTFEDIAEFTFDYGYRQTFSTAMTVRHIPGT